MTSKVSSRGRGGAQLGFKKMKNENSVPQMVTVPNRLDLILAIKISHCYCNLCRTRI